MRKRYRRGAGSAVMEDGEALLGDAVDPGEVAADVQVSAARGERPDAQHAGVRVHVRVPGHEGALERKHEELVPLDPLAVAMLDQVRVLTRRDVVAVHPEDGPPSDAGGRQDVP